MIKVLIQVAGGSTDRRIYNERTLEYQETRTGTLPYPYPYGFIPGTWSDDGACVDCYVITRDRLEAGSIVEREAAGLLEQREGEEIDHKVLALLPGGQVELNQEVEERLRNFISQSFANHPEMRVSVGQLLPREEALRHIEAFREDGG